jgi:hypothetical protein
MKSNQKMYKLIAVSFIALAIFATRAEAVPHALKITNGDPTQTITATIVDYNSCYQGPPLGNELTIKSGMTDVFNMGQNSAVSGCVGQVWIKFDPAPMNREYQGFDIHGGGILLSAAAGKYPNLYGGNFAKQPATYTTKRIPESAPATGTWEKFCNVGNCDHMVFGMDEETGDISKLTQSEVNELSTRIEACAKAAGAGSVYSVETNVCATRDHKTVSSWEFSNEKTVTKKMTKSVSFSISPTDMQDNDVAFVWNFVQEKSNGNGWTNQPPTRKRSLYLTITCPTGPKLPPYGMYGIPSSDSCSRLGK